MDRRIFPLTWVARLLPANKTPKPPSGPNKGGLGGFINTNVPIKTIIIPSSPAAISIPPSSSAAISIPPSSSAAISIPPSSSAAISIPPSAPAATSYNLPDFFFFPGFDIDEAKRIKENLFSKIGENEINQLYKWREESYLFDSYLLAVHYYLTKGWKVKNLKDFVKFDNFLPSPSAEVNSQPNQTDSGIIKISQDCLFLFDRITYYINALFIFGPGALQNELAFYQKELVEYKNNNSSGSGSPSNAFFIAVENTAFSFKTVVDNLTSGNNLSDFNIPKPSLKEVACLVQSLLDKGWCQKELAFYLKFFRELPLESEPINEFITEKLTNMIIFPLGMEKIVYYLENADFDISDWSENDKEDSDDK